MNRRPTDEQLGNLLKTPHFGQGGELPSSDPIAPTPMVLSLQQVKLYDRNPRRERNPLFDDIKDSIRNQSGLNNPLTVTRRPGEEIYMVESGGNTRLQILNELFEETGDEIFNQLHVLYRPWKSETHVLAAHLIENDKRGDMLFIDKALAIRELKTLFETEKNEQYSIRQLTERLRKEGYAIDQNLLSRMNYAIDVLLPLIPEALRAGMGRPQVAKIRKIEKAFLHYWTQISQQEASIFDELFQDCLAENNRSEWDANALRQTLEDRITELLDIPIRTMRLDIDALLRGREVEITSPPEETPWQTETPEKHHSIGGDGSASEGTPELTPSSPATELRGSTPATATTETSAPAIPPIAKETSYGFDDNEPVGATTLGITDLRHSAYETAHQLATYYQLARCVQPSYDWGLGFLVDLPEQPLIPDSSQELDAKQRWQQMVRQWIWWLLYICSEQTARPERIPNLPESMSIRRLCLEGNQTELMRRIGQPAWLSLSYQFLADPLVPDDHYQKLITLIQHCRTLRQEIGNDSDDPLWLERNDYA